MLLLYIVYGHLSISYVVNLNTSAGGGLDRRVDAISRVEDKIERLLDFSIPTNMGNALVGNEEIPVQSVGIASP